MSSRMAGELASPVTAHIRTLLRLAWSSAARIRTRRTKLVTPQRIVARWRGGVNRLSALLRLPLGPLRRLRRKAWEGARSCNMAVWRADLDKVDGFDADYSGWGKEDSDLIVRLLHAGVRRKDGTFATGVIHLWHKEADRALLSANEQKLTDIIGSDDVRAKRGLSALTPAVGAGRIAG